MKIIGVHTSTLETVKFRVSGREVHQRFINEMIPALWSAATEYAVDGVGMIAQAAKETNWGYYTGAVLPQFYNTAGIKIRHVGCVPGVNDGDKPLAHALFPSWEVGAIAHAQHLRAYAGVPVVGLIVDPRYWYALRTRETAVTDWSGLGGKWAPSPSYGVELEQIMATLR